MSSLKAVVYCRISQDRTGEGAGVERQRADCVRLAESLGWSVAEVYTDNDVSAYTAKPRPEYRKMLSQLATGDIGAVIAWHPDRLYRSLRDLTELIEVADAHGIEIRTVKAGEVDLTTPTGRLSASMVASISRYEVERLGERVKAAKDAQARAGRFRGGPRPFGYRDGGMELESIEADALRSAAQQFVAGTSLRSIARQWNEDGIKTVRGGQWRVPTMRKVLARARNAGLVEQQGRIIGPALWPAVFDEETLHAIRAILADPSRRTSTSYERKYQGASAYRCGRCGGPMKALITGHRADDGKVLDYTCGEKLHLTIRLKAADEVVDAVVVGRLSQPDAASIFVREVAEDTGALHTELGGLQARKNELARLFASGDIDAAQLSSGSADLHVKIDRIQSRLAALRSTSPVVDLVTADDVAERWATMSPDIRHKVIQALMTVTIMPAGSGSRVPAYERVHIEWKVA